MSSLSIIFCLGRIVKPICRIDSEEHAQDFSLSWGRLYWPKITPTGVLGSWSWKTYYKGTFVGEPVLSGERRPRLMSQRPANVLSHVLLPAWSNSFLRCDPLACLWKPHLASRFPSLESTWHDVFRVLFDIAYCELSPWPRLRRIQESRNRQNREVRTH